MDTMFCFTNLPGSPIYYGPSRKQIRDKEKSHTHTLHDAPQFQVDLESHRTVYNKNKYI